MSLSGPAEWMSTDGVAAKAAGATNRASATAAASRPATRRACRVIIPLAPSTSPYLRFLRQVGLSRVEDDRFVADEVGHRDGVGDVVDARSVAAVGNRPFGAADGGGAVLAIGGELALGVGLE